MPECLFSGFPSLYAIRNTQYATPVVGSGQHDAAVRQFERFDGDSRIARFERGADPFDRVGVDDVPGGDALALLGVVQDDREGVAHDLTLDHLAVPFPERVVPRPGFARGGAGDAALEGDVADLG